jgi:predicted RNA methylase
MLAIGAALLGSPCVIGPGALYACRVQQMQLLQLTPALHQTVPQGMLAIGAALLGSPCVIGLDVDDDALQVAKDNCEQFEDPLPVGFFLRG